MADYKKRVDVEIGAFGSTYRVKAVPENEGRLKQAAALLEKKVEEFSTDLKKTLNTPIPDQLFFAALIIADEMLMLREQNEEDKESRKSRIDELEQVVDKSLISRFIKLKMAYGAERKEGS